MTNFFSRKPIAFVSVAAVLALIVVLYFSIGAVSGVWHAVPSQTAMVLEFNSPQLVARMTEKIENPGWKSLFQSELFDKNREDAALVTSLLSQQNEFNEAMGNGRMLSAYTLNAADSMHALMVMELSNSFDLQKALLENKITQKYFPATFHNHTLFTVWFSKDDRMVLCQMDNLLLFSRFSYLVEESINQMEQSSSWWANRRYTHELNPDAPFHLFLQPAAVGQMLQKDISPLLDYLPDLISQNIEWLGFAWDGLQVTSMAETTGFLGQLSAFGTSPPGSLYSVVPDHTAMLVWTGFKKTNVFTDAVSDLQASDFQTYIAPWLGNGAALAITEPRSAAFREDELLFLAVKDSALAMQRLRNYGERQGTVQQETYQTFEVFTFLSNSILAPLLKGKANFQNPVCAMLDGYIVFAPTRSSLEVCIDKYIVSQTLVNTPDCIQLLSQLPQDGNAYILFNNQYINLLSQNFLNDISFVNNKESFRSLSKTGFLGASLNTTEPDKLSATWATQAPTSQVTQTGILWKTPLAAAVTSAPYLVTTASKVFIFVQDVDQQLYCLDASGTILWRRQMESPLLSTVQGVGIPNQTDTYFAFNTDRHIWLLDENGRDVGRFPVELRSPASNGVIAIDMDKNLKFNYFVACANGNIYGFDHTGSALPGWNPNSNIGIVKHPMCHFQSDGKDFLIALTSTAQLHVFGRSGQVRFPAISLSGQFASPPQVDANEQTPRIVCFNTQGKAFVCNAAGAVFSLQLGKGNQKCLGVFAPLKGDSRADFAVLQGNKLQASAYEGSSLKKAFSIQLPVPQDTIFEVYGQQIGLCYREKRQIFLVDNTGAIDPGFPLAGTGPFVVHPLRPGSRESLLIVGNGNQLYAYSIR